MTTIPKQISRKVIPSGRVGAVPIPTDIADTGAGIEAQGLGALGGGISNLSQSMSKIKVQQNKIEDNRSVAKGISSYNNIINEFNERLPSLDPKDYSTEFEKLAPQINGITNGLSESATEALNNRFEIWHETNRSKTAILSVKASSVLAKQEIPRQLAEFASDGVSEEEVDVYLDNFDGIMSPGEKELWKREFGSLQNKTLIFSAINAAAEDPTPENLKNARNLIKELSEPTRTRTKEEVIFSNTQKLRTKTANRTSS